MSLKRELESKFDPSDVDAAQQIAYKALVLMERAQMAIKTDNDGLRMGRDQKSDLNVAILELAQSMNLLGCWATGEEVQKFRNDLMGGPPPAQSGKEPDGTV
jgi:hypothetical protein